MWTWHFSQTDEIPAALFPEIARDILDVFNDGMGQGEWNWSIDQIEKTFESSDILGLLKNETGECGGYFFATLPQETLFRKSVLWIDACSVRKALQRNGYFHQALEVIKHNFPALDFGFIGGRTQNPEVLRIFDRLSPSNDYYPFEKPYSPQIMDFLKNNIANEIKKPSENNALNGSNGIIRNAYWGSRLGDYQIDLGDERIRFFEAQLDKWQFNRDDGDALIILKRL